ncbi:MAG: hypothetical protein ABF593_09490 [Acetobacter papayae]|uniref:hypothetical protein n=1 Tax=Acetobacter papayae TaxID=1076592 RepID=UPI0039EC769C
MTFVEEIAKNYSVSTNNFLVKYLVRKTRAAERGSKSRRSLGNLYTLFVLADDYVNDRASRHTDLLARMQSLPFGAKLQNHPLDNRLNDEFSRQFGVTSDLLPVRATLVDGQKARIISEDLLRQDGANPKAVARVVLDVVKTYIELITANQSSVLEEIQAIETPEDLAEFFDEAFSANSDARLFEIASYVLLAEHYRSKMVLIGPSADKLELKPLALFRTGRTNANDGGIDFVLQPLGRFFQVTETLNFRKYFLDFKKVNRYPISFVIKTENNASHVKDFIKKEALRSGYDNFTVANYMKLFEEIITLENLRHFIRFISDLSIERIKIDLSLQFQLEYGLLD